MTILVAYASKHGATRGVAERIAERLTALGHETEALPVDATPYVKGYEAAIIGSAIYYGSWMKEATEFVLRHRDALAARPVWLFSSGPLGVEVKGAEEQPKELAEFRDAIHPRGYQLFFGALDHKDLSFPERMVVKAVRAPEGDYRDWQAIDAWAERIAHDLEPSGHEAATPPAPEITPPEM
ncbi:MAG TPA: flavodoxin domain-containing protein [Ktedonobacterales bacterium]|nr:flavodoxin domain-containing protein [Ktedonobacterales bacterium]